MYTGMNAERTDMYVPGGKHSRHYNPDEQGEYRKVRSSKYRYIYFCTRNKHLKKSWQSRLNYSILPYPKGDNSNYILGNYLQEKIIKV